MSARKCQFLIYIIFFSLSVAFPSLNGVCMIAIVGLNFLFVVTKANVELSVLTTMVMGNEMLSLINALSCVVGMFIIGRSELNTKRGKVKRTTILVVGLILANSLLNGVVNNTVINVVFYVGYLLILYICFKGISGALDLSRSVIALKQLITIEAIATGIRIVNSRRFNPGDYFSGTLNNAHFFGNWLILTGIVLIILYKRKYKFNFNKEIITKKELVWYLVILLPMLYLADAKQIILSLIIAIAVYGFVKLISIKRNNVLFWTIIGMYAGLAFALWLSNLEPIRNLLTSNIPGYSVYIYQDGLNGRYAFAYGTYFDSLASLRLFFGYGLGQYGSRVANAFAYTEMWRANNFINNFIASHFEPHFIPQFTRYVTYYDAAFVERIRYYSAVLSYPFSSFIALIGETGVVGTVMVAHIINKIFKKSNAQFLIIYFLSICVFDIYFDDFQCAIAVIIYILVLNERSFLKNITDRQVSKIKGGIGFSSLRR